MVGMDTTEIQHLRYNDSNVKVSAITDINASVGFNILYINARSIRNDKLDILKEMLAIIEVDIQIIIIVETWLHENEVQYYNIKGYEGIHGCRTNDKRGGGVSIFIKNELNYKIRKEYNTDQNNIMIAEITNLKWTTKLILGGIYKSPSVNKETEEKFLAELEEAVSSIRTEAIIIGDTNININNTRQPSVKYTDMIMNYGFRIANIHPTRTTDTTKTLIDHVLTNIPGTRKLTVYNILNDLSDHDMIVLNVSKINRQPSDETKHTHTYTIVNHQNMRQYLAQNPIELPDNNCIDVVYEEFNRQLQKAITVNTKEITKRNRNTQKNTNIKIPWMNTALLNLINNKNKEYQKLKRNPRSETLSNNYKAARNLVTTLRRQLRTEYYNNRFSENIKNSRSTWKIINNAINRQETAAPKESTLSMENGEEITDPTEIAEAFNKYFVNIGPSLVEKMENQVEHKIRTGPTTNNGNFQLRAATTNEVYKILTGLKNKTSKDEQGITNKTLKELKQEIAEPIAHIANKSFNTGTVPKILKISRVIPVFKTGNTQDPSNYRPISIVPIISKVIETLVEKRLRDYLNQTEFLCSNQYGFIPHSNTQAAVADLVIELQKAIDKDMITAGIFIDLKKAFDTVDHDILIDKLEAINVKGNALNWFRSYLTMRQQYVTLNNGSSTKLEVQCGVPQGSVLGPLLFLIYINDIQRCQLHGKLKLFADDTNIFYESESTENIFAMMQEDVNILTKWLRKNKLTLNIKKTKYMLIYKTKIQHNRELKINEIDIEETNAITYLGITINNTLTWENHIENIKRKINPITGILKKLQGITSESIRRSVYYALIDSHLKYLNIIWGNTSQTLLKPLETLQNRAIRNIYNLPYRTHRAQMYKETRIMPLQMSRDMNTIIYTHNIMNNRIKTNTRITTNNDIHSYNTRNRTNMHTESINTHRYGKTALNHQMINLYNQLPKHLKEEMRPTIFKKQLQVHLISNMKVNNCE